VSASAARLSAVPRSRRFTNPYLLID
jgi:hypothetical protein